MPPKIVGILNITPDSFYDGGRYLGPQSCSRLKELIKEGAHVIDIGAESSRPGSSEIGVEEERERLRPIFKFLATTNPLPALISIDTRKAAIAREAIACGATMVNDITGCRFDPDGMTAVLRESPQVKFILMHMQGRPQTMQNNPYYDDVFGSVSAFFTERMAFLERSGISRERLILDPGIGFGKSPAHNLTLLNRVGRLRQEFGLPILVGASRKSFIAVALDGMAPAQRLEGSLAVALWCAKEGVDYLRVHDVRSTRDVLTMWQALEKAPDRVLNPCLLN